MNHVAQVKGGSVKGDAQLASSFDLIINGPKFLGRGSISRLENLKGVSSSINSLPAQFFVLGILHVNSLTP